ncbi:MAG: hypothetical protein HY609_03670 [Deltaproteobacteria bacterium]|nr:hypothetical protein [Deltaproteobacteria bacterium]MBI4224008.1 hypothetical protein [Deltaproteobacteria bacterium]
MRKINNRQGQAAVGYALALAVVAVGMGVVLNSPELRQGIAEFYTNAATRVIHGGKFGESDLTAAKDETWGSAPSDETAGTPTESGTPSGGDGTGAGDGSSGGSSDSGQTTQTGGGGLGTGGVNTPGTVPGETTASTGPSTQPTAPTGSVPPEPGAPKGPFADQNMSSAPVENPQEPAQCEAAADSAGI